MAWAPNWWERREAILRHGLPSIVLGARIIDGFVALYFDIDDALLLRSHAARGFPLHLTLGYTSDYGDGVAEAAVQRLNQRYAGQWLMLSMRRRLSQPGPDGLPGHRRGHPVAAQQGALRQRAPHGAPPAPHQPVTGALRRTKRGPA